MINGEKYREEILNNCNGEFGLSNRIVKCTYEECASCVFSNLNNQGDHVGCSVRRIKWLLSEYKEPIKVSGLEHELLKFWYESGCCYRYIARDSSGNLFLYVKRPTKKAEVWASIEWHKFISDFNDLFKFIQWEDSEPTSIKEVLENCEVVEDESSK